MSTINIVFFVSLVVTLIVSAILAVYENAYKVPKYEKLLNVTLGIGACVLFVSSVMSAHFI